MRKITTILMGLLLTFTLVLGVMPREMVKAEPTSYDLTIAGVEVTSDNLSGEGWSFDPSTYTLTLSGNINGGIECNQNSKGTLCLRVNVSSDVSINTLGAGIMLNGNWQTLIVEGTGTLTVNISPSDDATLYMGLVADTVQIDNGVTVNVNLPNYKVGIMNVGITSYGGVATINGNANISFADASDVEDISELQYVTQVCNVGLNGMGVDIQGGTVSVRGCNVGVQGSVTMTGGALYLDTKNAGIKGNVTITSGTATISANGTKGVAVTGSRVVAPGASVTLTPNPEQNTNTGTGSGNGGTGTSSGESSSGSSSSSSSSTSNTPATSTTQVVQKEDGTTETITTTKVSATETVIASSTGVEQRRIAVQFSDGQVSEGIKVAGATTVIPSGASFSYNTWAMDSPNFVAVQTAIQASGNEELQKATKVQAIEFNLSHSNGTAIHQLGDYVQVSFPLASFYNDSAATVPAGKQLVVYRVEDDGTLTRCNTTVVNGEIIFSTNHFSTYIVVEETARTAAPKTGESSLGFVWLLAIVLVGVSGALFVRSRKNRFV